MTNRLIGTVLLVVAIVVAGDTCLEIWQTGATGRNLLILLVALLIGFRGVMRFTAK